MAELQVYIGPHLKGVAYGTVLNNGLPAALQDEIKETPAIGELVVPVSGLAAAVEALSDPDSAMSRFYQIAKERAKKGA